jgi:hypothetical protein
MARTDGKVTILERAARGCCPYGDAYRELEAKLRSYSAMQRELRVGAHPARLPGAGGVMRLQPPPGFGRQWAQPDGPKLPSWRTRAQTGCAPGQQRYSCLDDQGGVTPLFDCAAVLYCCGHYRLISGGGSCLDCDYELETWGSGCKPEPFFTDDTPAVPDVPDRHGDSRLPPIENLPGSARDLLRPPGFLPARSGSGALDPNLPQPSVPELRERARRFKARSGATEYPGVKVAGGKRKPPKPEIRKVPLDFGSAIVAAAKKRVVTHGAWGAERNAYAKSNAWYSPNPRLAGNEPPHTDKKPCGYSKAGIRGMHARSDSGA